MKRITKPALIAFLAIALAACGQKSNDTAPSAEGRHEPQTALGRTVAKAIDEARLELAKENLKLNQEFSFRVSNVRVRRDRSNDLPNAEITPQGQLLIENQPVAMSEAQKQLSLAYRRDILAVAEAGMDIGAHGADFGMRAARDAVVGIFSGNMDEVEKKIEAEARQFEVAALKLCALLPAVLASQEAFAASVAEFRPYAKMTQADVDDCSDKHRDSGTDDDIAAGVTTDPATEADAAAGADPVQ